MCIVAHVHYRHFAYFMNREPVVAVVVERRYGKNGVEHCREIFLPAHKVYKALHVVEYRPCVVPAVALGKVPAPFKRRKVLLECAVSLAPAHQVVFAAEQVAVVEGTLLKLAYLLFGPFQFLCYLQYAPVVVCIFQCACSTLMYSRVAWNVTQTVILFMPGAPCR